MKRSIKMIHRLLLLSLVIGVLPGTARVAGQAQQGSGSIGIEGIISSPAPTTSPSIAIPANGQTFTNIPITVSGICQSDLLVKLFKNNVFGGSALCVNGSYSITTDLFVGRNELVTRHYDALDQAGPDSNVVSVTFNDGRPGGVSRPTLTSSYAKRGANPGETLTWPIVLSGGTGPYAVNVDWGDGKPSDIFSRPFPGSFDISHIYDRPGAYNIIIRVSDSNGNVAFLQLVGIANGALVQTAGTGDNEPIIIERNRLAWLPFALMAILMPLGFWLGRRYQLRLLQKRWQA